MLAEMRWAGFPEAEVDKARAEAIARWRPVEGAYEVHPWNGLPIRLLLATQTQWRFVSLSTATKAMVVRSGLDYGAVEQVARLEGLGEISPSDFRRLRIAEAEALAAWQEERERAR